MAQLVTLTCCNTASRMSDASVVRKHGGEAAAAGGKYSRLAKCVPVTGAHSRKAPVRSVETGAGGEGVRLRPRIPPPAVASSAQPSLRGQGHLLRDVGNLKIQTIRPDDGQSPFRLIPALPRVSLSITPGTFPETISSRGIHGQKCSCCG
jgi:hypothetical protein